MDGYAVCPRELRQRTLFDNTGRSLRRADWAKPKIAPVLNESGFDHHLVKPVNMDRLEKLLAGILSARRDKSRTHLMART